MYYTSFACRTLAAFVTAAAAAAHGVFHFSRISPFLAARRIEGTNVQREELNNEHYLSKTDVTSVATGRCNKHYSCCKGMHPFTGA